jgi:hypothetical protein
MISLRRLPPFLTGALSNRLVQFGLIAGALFALAPGAENPSRIELHHERLDELHTAAARKAGLVVLPYFSERSADFTRPARMRFQHVFAQTEAALPPRPADAEGTPGHPVALGQSGPVPPEMVGDERTVTEALGADVARLVLTMPEGRWEGPIRSPFGFHHVKVLAREAARPARFEEVRGRVIEQESVNRRRRAVADFLAKAFARYDISLDGQAVSSLPPPARIAMRSFSSGED